jgi:hypothetical protein
VLGRKLVILIAAALLAAALAGCSIGSYEWQSLKELSYLVPEIERFRYRVRITVNNAPFAEAFTDFPVLVRLDGTNDVSMSRLGEDPNHLRFYSADLQQELDFEVERWDPPTECCIWVKVPSIPASANTGRFYLYYGYDSIFGLSGHCRDVWSDHFAGVWHLNERWHFEYRDSGPGCHEGGLEGNTVSFTPPEPAEGVIGGGQRWADATDGIGIPPVAESDLGPFTVSLWVNMEDLAASNAGRLFEKAWPGNQGGFTAYITGGDIQYEIKADTGAFADNRVLRMNGVMDEGTWHWWTFRYDGTFTIISPTEKDNYKDGVSMIGDTAFSGAGNSAYDGDDDAYLHLGNSSFDNTRSIRAVVDELRVSTVMRSEEWIRAQYASMTDSYLSFGPEEQMSYGLTRRPAPGQRAGWTTARAADLARTWGRLSQAPLSSRTAEPSGRVLPAVEPLQRQ